ncbi:MAG: GntR family transcriptional regulator, partial [Candidatus Promineifilaceae bacterium]
MLKRGLGTQAADVLRNDILSGVLQPGEQITEEGLAKQLGVSRSTIRTSIQQLVHEGIIRYEPYKGNAVRSLNAHDAWEIYTLRNTLEAL